MFSPKTLAFASLLLLALAAPTPTNVLEPRASQCGQWDSIATGDFTLYADLWGESAGTGSQCSTVSSASGDSINWSTSWSWSGGSSSVKSYTNAVYNIAATQLSAIKTIPTTWSWSYTGSNIVADVSYDTFLATSPTASNEYEVMVWLGALGGAGPTSSTGSTPYATPTIGGTKFNLFKGPNGSTTVYSFVRAGSDVTNYSGDLKAFFTYLQQNDGVSSSLYLISIGAGTEPFTGSNAVLTNKYSLQVTK